MDHSGAGERGVPMATAAAAGGVLAACSRNGWNLAVAESLTGGLLASAIVDIPGASAVFRGGVVAYSSQVKADVLGVDEQLLAAAGAVDPRVALAMAAGVCRVLGSAVGVATTGVAGPAPADGKDVGCAFIAVHTPHGGQVRQLRLVGGRSDIRRGCVLEALTLAFDTLTG